MGLSLGFLSLKGVGIPEFSTYCSLFTIHVREGDDFLIGRGSPLLIPAMFQAAKKVLLCTCVCVLVVCTFLRVVVQKSTTCDFVLCISTY